jgi:hypothetical protein
MHGLRLEQFEPLDTMCLKWPVCPYHTATCNWLYFLTSQVRKGGPESCLICPSFLAGWYCSSSCAQGRWRFMNAESHRMQVLSGQILAGIQVPAFLRSSWVRPGATGLWKQFLCLSWGMTIHSSEEPGAPLGCPTKWEKASTKEGET